MIRQGDILFIPTTETAPENAIKVDSGIVAAGEATGHHHRIAANDMPVANLLKTNWQGDLMLVVSERNVNVIHEEHKPVTLSPGNYLIHRAREYDYLSNLVRNVRD